MKFILGEKIEMSQIFNDKGKVVPITLIKCGPCYILQKKTKENDGYEAIQLGFKKIKEKKIHPVKSARGGASPEAKQFNRVKKTSKGKEFKYAREQRITGDEQYKVGDKIEASIFKEGDMVKISGISKGKGFQGAVKRWGFHGRNATHGVKHEQRTLGSVGSSFPQKVIKGKKMPGRMGAERVTVKNLKVAKVDAENNLLAVKGAVPGRRRTLLEIRGE